MVVDNPPNLRLSEGSDGGAGRQLPPQREGASGPGKQIVLCALSAHMSKASKVRHAPPLEKHTVWILGNCAQPELGLITRVGTR